MAVLDRSQEPRGEGHAHAASLLAQRINLDRFFGPRRKGVTKPSELYSRS
jgi:hypothetical protein